MARVSVFIISVLIMATSICLAGGVKIGEQLPVIKIDKKGMLVPEFVINGEEMVFKKGSKIKYRKWDIGELKGKVISIYHLAARDGIDKVNQSFIDALIAANLPEKLPNSPYKTTTILNTDDAMWGTAGIASSRLKKSQEEFAYAYYVNDSEGIARQAWGLRKRSSTVIILDTEGKVIFFKDGKLSQKEIEKAVALIEKELAKIK